MSRASVAGVEGMFVGVDLAGGQFEEDAPQRITELPLHHQSPIIEQGNDHDRTGVAHVLPTGVTPIGQRYLVAVDLEEMAPVDFPGGDTPLSQVGIVRSTALQRSIAHAAGSALAPVTATGRCRRR